MKSHGWKKFRDVVHASTPEKKNMTMANHNLSIGYIYIYTSSNGRFLHCHVSFAGCMLNVSSLG